MMYDGIEMVNLKKKLYTLATKLAYALKKNQELKVWPQFLPEAYEQFCLQQPDLWLEQFSK